MKSFWKRPEPWVFAILFLSYAYFWHSRDWNSASRLMLTYAMVDRGTVTITGLEDQTGDRASFRGEFYTDKLPGFSFLATLPYSAAKVMFRLPNHPLNVKGFTHWPADYWVTLGTSGLLTALTGVVLVSLASQLGCGPRRSALVGLAYGLGTPAFAYATMSYGHQAAAFAMLASLALLWHPNTKWKATRAGFAGFLASYAAVIELSVGPISAILGLYLLAQLIGWKRKLSTVGDFAVGAAIPALLLLGYNQLAYGSLFDMGYFHHTTKIFADVHSEENPLGLKVAGVSRAFELLWGRHRGLLFYAPIVALVPFGLVSLARRRLWGLAIVSVAAMGAVFAVNLSYPEWTGGWSTGPRLLVPLLPFAMLPVAGLLARAGKTVTALAVGLSVFGWLVVLSCLMVGGRLPQSIRDPIVEAVIPLIRGETFPGWPGEPFARNLLGWLAPNAVAGLPASLRWMQFLPLVIGEAVLIGLMLVVVGRDSDPRVDREQENRREHQDTENPAAEPGGVEPDQSP